MTNGVTKEQTAYDVKQNILLSVKVLIKTDVEFEKETGLRSV